MADDALSLSEAVTELRRLKRLWQSIERLEGVVKAVQVADVRAAELAGIIAQSESEVMRLEGVVLEAREQTERTVADLLAQVETARADSQAKIIAAKDLATAAATELQGDTERIKARLKQELSEARSAHTETLSSLHQERDALQRDVDAVRGALESSREELAAIQAIVRQTKQGLKDAGVTL